MNKNIFILFAMFLLILFVSLNVFAELWSKSKFKFWNFQSIDTMKYSRDLSKEKLNDPDFDKVIEMQIKNIADTGATHVALATPYDSEFLPILRRWILYARKYNLEIWFRGNWSGWERWFGYPSIDEKTHIEKTKNFILSNPDIFENGDIFTACPECENGGRGDPRTVGHVQEYRKFLIDEYKVNKNSFSKIGKNVKSNYNSMNADVARLVMDKQTTKALDGIVVIDHYVGSGDQLVSDIESIARSSGGKVVLGEFGAPIPDINGNLNEEQQYEWIKDAFSKLVKLKELDGINYWTSVGGSTQLWDDSGKGRKALQALTNIYNPRKTTGIVQDLLGDPVVFARLTNKETSVTTSFRGEFEIPYIYDDESITISANGYKDKSIQAVNGQKVIVLENINKDILFNIRKYLKQLSSLF